MDSTGDMEDPIARELSRFKSSPNSEHRHLCAIGEAMAEVIREQGLEPSPTAYFASAMAALERELSERAEANAVTAMLTFLSIALPKVPPPVLRAKNDTATALVLKASELSASKSREESSQAAAKSGIICLQHLLVTSDKSNWPSIARPFAVLLRYCVDHRPKVRKRAQSSMVEVIAEVQGSTALNNASDAIVSFSENLMLSAMRSAPAEDPTSHPKKRKNAPTKPPAPNGDSPSPSDPSPGTKSAIGAFHMLGALKLVASLLSERAITVITARLMELYELGQPLLIRHVLETLQSLFRSPTARVHSSVLNQTLARVLQLEEKRASRKRDVDEIRAISQVVQLLLGKFLIVDRPSCVARVPLVFHAFTGYLTSEQEEVIFISGEFLRALIIDFIDESMVVEALSGMRDGPRALDSSGPTSMERIVSSVEKILQYQFSTAWDVSLLLVAALFEKLGKHSSILMSNILHSLVDMQGLPDKDMKCRKQLHSAFGSAIQAMGIENFLKIVPLNLDSQDLSNSRIWLIPILKQYSLGSSLDFFLRHFVPIALQLRERAKKAESEGRPVASKNLEACVYAIWSILPSMCHYCSDTSTSFPLIAKIFGDVITREETLRPFVCLAIQTLIVQNRKARGEPPINDTIDKKIHHIDQEDESIAEMEARDAITEDIANSNLRTIASFSKNFFPLLFNAFLSTPLEKRAEIQFTIVALASISETSEVKKLFVAVMQKLLKASQEAAAEAANKPEKNNDIKSSPSPSLSSPSPNAQRCSFIDLSMALASGLDSDSVNMLWISTKPALQDEDNKVQKKAYKLLAHLSKTNKDFIPTRSDELLEEILTCLITCHSSSKKYRLTFIHHLIIFLLKTDDKKKDEAILALLSEIILATKENNKKTRNEAYVLLIRIGESLQQPGNVGNYDSALQKYFQMVVGGLAGTTPHMISATVVSLARLLYEFSSDLVVTVPELLPSVLMLLRSPTREVIKSCLGFIKVVISRLPVSELEAYVPNILEAILLWANDPKNNFKMKVRVVVERLVRRCGINLVSQSIPEEHKKLLTHIRKTNQKLKKKKSAGASIAGDETKSVKSRASTSKKSAWNHTEVFSDDDEDDDDTYFDNDDDDDEEEDDMASLPSKSTKGPRSRASISASSARAMRNRKLKARLPEDGSGETNMDENPLDLLDTNLTRKALTKPSLKQHLTKDKPEHEIGVSEDGRMIILENDNDDYDKKKRNRDNEDGEGDDDDDREDDVEGGSHGGKSSKNGDVRAGRGRKRMRDEGVIKGNKTIKKGNKTMSAGKETSGYAYTGKGYASRGKGSGDVKKDGKVEPYAYWPLDHKMINKREAKKAVARKGMASVLNTNKTRKVVGVNLDVSFKGKKSIVKGKQKAHKGKGKGKSSRAK